MVRVVSFLLVALSFQELLAEASEECKSRPDRSSKATLKQGPSLVQLSGADKSQLKKRHRASASTSSVALDAASDAALAREIRSYFFDFGNIGSSLMGGFDVFTKVIPFFTQETPEISTPQIDLGFGAMGEGLLEVITSMVPSGQAGDLAQFSDMFMKIFEDLPSAVPDLTEMLGNFHETGNDGALIEAFDKVLDQVGMQVADILPSGSGLEIANYVGALKDLLESVGDGSGEVQLGDVESAIKAIADGVFTATESLAPAGSNTEGALEGIMGQLDPGIGGFFDMIGGFQHQVEQSKVCWKSEDTVLREKVRANKCPENYEFDGHHWCVAADSSLLQKSSADRVSCSSTADCYYEGCDQQDLVVCDWDWANVGSKVCYTGTYDSRCYGQGPGHLLEDGGWCFMNRRDIYCPSRPTTASPTTTTEDANSETSTSMSPESTTSSTAGVSSSSAGVSSTPAPETSTTGTPSSTAGPASTPAGSPGIHKVVPPHCDAEGEFPEQMGSWCYKACPPGSEPSGPNKHNCKAACVDGYPFSDPAAPLLCGKTAEAMQQAVMHMVGSSMQTVVGAVVGGFTGVGLPGTFSSIVEMGKSFAHPKCPIGAQ